MSSDRRFRKLKKEIESDLYHIFVDDPSYEDLKKQIKYVKKKVQALGTSDDDEIKMHIYDPILRTLENNLYACPEYELEVYGLNDDFGGDPMETSFYKYKSNF